MHGVSETRPTEQGCLNLRAVSGGAPQENFRAYRRKLIRETIVGSRSGLSSMPLPLYASTTMCSEELRRVWWRERLMGTRPTVPIDPRREEINIVDLCSGCGGLATGVKWACEAVGVRPVIQMCLEISTDAINVYKNNLRPLRALHENLSNLVSYRRLRSQSDEVETIRPRIENRSVAELIGKVDLVIAGPPCEGNSNFNNRTRRRDGRNELYTTAVACAIALQSRSVVVENVETVKRAHQKVVERSLNMLEDAGYQIGRSESLLVASWFGTPQDRRRHFLIASKTRPIDMSTAFEGLKCRPIEAMEAIGDLVGTEADGEFDRPARISPENERRVRYLIENDAWDLPNTERPDCHKDGHSYPSVYGRMYPDRPAQTLTTGFMSPGRGRFTHPLEARGLTPHEGARLQGFPDDFAFAGPRGSQVIGRQSLAHLIGDAVPPQLGYAVGLGALSIL